MTVYSKNKKNTNDIIKFFISKGIKTKFTFDIRYYKEVDWYSPDITISPIIKGLPSFQFWYSLNNEVNNMYMHLTIPSDIYNKNIHYINYKKEYEEILKEKIFIIDDGSHSTMLFAKEY